MSLPSNRTFRDGLERAQLTIPGREEGADLTPGALRNLLAPIPDRAPEEHAPTINSMPESLCKGSVPGDLCVGPALLSHAAAPADLRSFK